MIGLAFGFFIFVVLVVYLVDWLTVKRVWHDPLYIFLFFLVVYVSPLSLRYILDMPVEGNVTFYFNDLRSVYPLALFATSVSVILFYIAYRIAPVITLTKSINRFALKAEKRHLNFEFAAFLMLLTGVSLFILLTRSHGGLVEVILRGYAVTEIFSKNPLIPLSLSMVTTSSILMLCAYSQSKKKIYFIFSLAIIAAVMILQIVLARRAAIAIWGLTYLITYSYLIRHLTFKKILPLAVMGFVFLNVLGYARGANYDSISSFTQSLSRQFERLESDKSGMFYTLATGQFVIPFETVPMLMEKLPSNEMRYGATVFDIVTQWIPRSIWPQKNYGNTEWYYKRYYDKHADTNEGRAFFFLAEGYLNFGLFGMLLWAVLWGGIWKNIAFLASNKGAKTMLGAFIVAAYTGAIIILLPGDFVGLFVGFIKSSLLWFIIAYLIALLFSKRKRI